MPEEMSSWTEVESDDWSRWGLVIGDNAQTHGKIG